MFFNAHSNIPKYKQIVLKVIDDVDKGLLKVGDALLSINEFSEEHEIARDTVEKAYKDLREKGIIISIRSKGYYIDSTKTTEKHRIFLHFNKLSAYKKTVYDAFVKTIGDKGQVDIFIHHNDLQLFENQLAKALGNYTNYVVIPPDIEEKESVARVLKRIPPQKLLILDKYVEGFDGVAAVYQNFETDIINALTLGLEELKKYRKLSLVFPKRKGYASEVMLGFTKFCSLYDFEFDIISEIQENKVNEGKVFIVIEEEALVHIIKFAKAKTLKLGKDVGVISYNETLLKEILADGITVISTDFEEMGHNAARLLLENKKEQINNTFRLIKRQSL